MSNGTVSVDLSALAMSIAEAIETLIVSGTRQRYSMAGYSWDQYENERIRLFRESRSQGKPFQVWVRSDNSPSARRDVPYVLVFEADVLLEEKKNGYYDRKPGDVRGEKWIETAKPTPRGVQYIRVLRVGKWIGYLLKLAANVPEMMAYEPIDDADLFTEEA